MAVLSRVDIVGGSYRGKAGVVVGQTKDFYKVELDGGKQVCRTKKNNVKFTDGALGLETGDAPDVRSTSPTVAEAQSETDCESGPEDDGVGEEPSQEVCHVQGKLAGAEWPRANRSGILEAHSLVIMTWNANKMSFLGRNDESMREHVESWAAEVARLRVEVLVLQEVPFSKGPARLEELRQRLNSALLNAGQPEGTLFGEAVLSEVGKGSEVHALLVRAPIQLEKKLTLDVAGEVAFKYPPLLVCLRDDRFSMPELRRLILTSVHTPGSSTTEAALQRVHEVKALLNSLHREASGRLGAEELLFCDRKATRKIAAAATCAAPWIICGDLNVDLLQPEKCLPKELRGQQPWEGVRIEPEPELAAVKLHADPGCWVTRAPGGGVTSSGGKRYDWFLWNADVGKRLCTSVRPVCFTSEAVRRLRQVGVSDHDSLILELSEVRVREDQRKRPVHT